MEHTCKNCETVHIGNYCHQCGQIVINKRFTLKQVLGHAITSLLNFDMGRIYTFLKVLWRPHVVVNDFISGATRKYTNPVSFAVYLLVLFAIMTHFYKEGHIELGAEETVRQIGMPYNNLSKFVLKVYLDYINYFQLFQIPFLALFTRWIFKKYNYAEHFILHCYTFSAITIATGVVNFIAYLLIRDVMSDVYNLVEYLTLIAFFLYYAYVFRKLFRRSYISSFFNAVLILFLSLISISLFLGIVFSIWNVIMI